MAVYIDPPYTLGSMCTPIQSVSMITKT